MNSTTWAALVAELSAPTADICVKAAERIHKESTAEDIPRLLGLLESEDFFVREAAAWPLAELAGPEVLPRLLPAYQRGFDQGHDNDGFTAALLEIPALYPTEAVLVLENIAGAATEPIRSHALWLLEFCKPLTAPLRQHDA